MRNIQTALFSEIDKRLLKNGAAQHAIQTKDARSLFIHAVSCLVGTREVGGNNRGPLVQLIQKTVDGSADAEAWCMCFVQTGIAYVEKKLGVKSPISHSEHCMTTWRNTAKVQRVKKIPAPGAICIWKKGSSDSGHTGVVLEYKGSTMIVCEGNTEAGIVGGKVERDGGGVYITERSTKGTESMTVQGFLIPFEVATTDSAVVPSLSADLSLSWNKPEWTAHLVKHLKANKALFDSAKDIEDFCPGYSQMSEQKQIKALGEFFCALAYFESAWNPKTSSVDVGKPGDKDTYSVGLYQVSVADQSWAGGGYKYTFAQLCEALPNIDLAMALMKRQLTKTGLLALPNSSKYRYWAVLLIGNRFSKITEIKARIAKNLQGVK